eukprot:4550300-Pleurochrysis_carterae.AAC.1
MQTGVPRCAQICSPRVRYHAAAAAATFGSDDRTPISEYKPRAHGRASCRAPSFASARRCHPSPCTPQLHRLGSRPSHAAFAPRQSARPVLRGSAASTLESIVPWYTESSAGGIAAEYSVADPLRTQALERGRVDTSR